MNRLQLLDLPPVWLGSLILALEGCWQVRPLFRTCTKLQQLIFHQPAIRPKVDVTPEYIQSLGCPLFARAIAMAEAAETKLHLDLEVTCAGKAALSLLFTTVALYYPAQQAQQPLASLQLTCITAVTIDGVSEAPLFCILPDTLVQHCPNLQELCLYAVNIADQYSAPQLTCTSLQKLIFVYSDGFKQHLLNLPSLTALDLRESGEVDDYEEGGVFWAAIARYSFQLRALRCQGIEMPGLPCSPATQLPLVQELELAVGLEGDDALQQLLTSAPIAKRVGLHSVSGLKSSFADVLCTWEKLELHYVHVAELAKLPLSSCISLKCLIGLYMRSGEDDDQPSPEQITAGVKAAEAAGGPEFSTCSGVDVSLYPDDLERLTAATPLLQRIRAGVQVKMLEQGDQVTPWSDCRALLSALGQHVRCRWLEVHWNGWADNPGAVAQLPVLLPGVEGFHFFSAAWGPPPEAELIQMVRTASRRFSLHLPYNGPQAQLQQAMQEAGHQLVTIE